VGAAQGLPPIYEGPETLAALLLRAGAEVTVEEVIERFGRAVAQQEPRSAVIPGLFVAEPRFASPDEARRLYGNLFGLWARLEAGLGAHDDAPDLVPEPPPPPPLPERGLTPGRQAPPDLVEAVWKHLAAEAPRELSRRRDRYMNVQADVVAWLDGVPLPESGALAATDLAFEAWAMLDQAFGERLGMAEWKALKRLEQEPPPAEVTQPAVAAYAAEALDTLAAEDPAFDEAARAQVEKVVATLLAALTGALREPS
jgi:pyruvate/2-oxoglutarate dehydrogenase complex dihydrolipoamide acyltransferase (E2) component